ncbi:MAG: hypothetical protein ACK5KT_05535 [Dysgonomonas sp.]
MDLDNIKKSWQNADVKPIINEDKIQRILDNRGKGAFDALLKYDKLFFWLLIPCFLLGLLISFFMHPLPGIFYSILVIIGFFWQAYKIKVLKSFDLSAMGILEVSKCITKYKKYIVYEILIGLVSIIPFFIFYTYYGLPEMFPRLYQGESASTSLLIILIIEIVLTLIISYWIYKRTYLKNIRKIEKSVKEIEYFENDNI